MCRFHEAHRTSAMYRRQRELADTEVVNLKPMLRSLQGIDDRSADRDVELGRQ